MVMGDGGQVIETSYSRRLQTVVVEQSAVVGYESVGMCDELPQALTLKFEDL